jgi:hypothetical protein
VRLPSQPLVWKSETTQVVLVLAASGIGGLHAGIVTFPDWQVAVETAQVVAGMVDYPPENPFYLYHLKLWTILHQICALLLLSGVSEIALSKILSGLIGMVSLQALALIVYALGRDTLLAIGAAFLIAFTRTAEYGVNYPIYLMGTSHTYGALGLSMVALISGFAGAGWYRTGAFLLGVAPAVHPSIGAWFVLSVAVAAVWHFRRTAAEVVPALKFLVAGGGVTALSLLVHLVQSWDIPAIDPDIAGKYLASFVAFWDAHRQPANPSADGTKLTMGTLALAVVWLKLSPDLSRSATFLLRLITITASLGLALVLVSFFPPAAVPSTLLILMPGRFLNLNALIGVAVLLGLIGALGTSGRRIWSGLLALYLSFGLFISNRSLLWEWPRGSDEGALRFILQAVDMRRPTRPLQILLAVLVTLTVVTAVSWWRAHRVRSVGRTPTAPVFSAHMHVPGALARGATLLTLACAAALFWYWPPRPVNALFLDRTNSPMFARAAATRGLLLTGGDVQLVQLRTRRPVLVDGGGLDGLPYALESGPALEQILRDVYGIDLFNPPEEARRKGAIPNEFNRETWQGFSRERWQQIRLRYHVTQVLADSRWALALPVVAYGAGLTLYEIPD